MPSPPLFPPRRKSVQAILLETVMFVSLFAVVGHLSVNFWERYVIQSELAKMKTSLYSMKETINFIGDAYDNLHKEVLQLAEITEVNPTKPPYAEKEPSKPKQLDKSTLERKTLHDLEVQTIVKNRHQDREVLAAPVTVNRTTDNILHRNRFGKNSKSTITNFLWNQKSDKEKNEVLIAVPSNRHKTTNINVEDDSKVHRGKDATTITRYPLKSTGAGKEVPLQKIEDHSTQSCKHTHRHIHSPHKHIHQCYNDAEYILYNHTYYPYNHWKF